METGQGLNLHLAPVLEDLCMLLPFELPASLNIWWWKRKPLAFSPLLCSLYAPLAPFIKRCSSFVATRKHAERGLAYNRASFSRVTASMMLSATLLHVYCSKMSKTTPSRKSRRLTLGFLMVRPMAVRDKTIPSIWLVPLAGLAPGCQSSAVSADDLSRVKPVSWFYPSIAFDAVDLAASCHSSQGFGLDAHLLCLLFGGEVFGHRREPFVKFLGDYLSDFFCCHFLQSFVRSYLTKFNLYALIRICSASSVSWRKAKALRTVCSLTPNMAASFFSVP